MQGDLNRSTGKKTATGKDCQQPISQCQFYTLHSLVKSRDKVLLLNFEPADIKVNQSALEEVVRMRKESLFTWQHLLIEFNGINMCLFNRRLWNGHYNIFSLTRIFSLCQSIQFHRSQYK